MGPISSGSTAGGSTELAVIPGTCLGYRVGWVGGRGGKGTEAPLQVNEMRNIPFGHV